MRVTTRAIVLSSIKYGDTSLIVKMFTETDGLRTYLLKGVLNSKKGKLKIAYFQPLTQLEIVAVHRNKGSMERLQEVRVTYPYETLHTDVIKNSLAFFLAEMMSNSIQEEEQNQALFHFLEAAFQWVDHNRQIANFHLYFLLELTKYLGFYPDVSPPRSAYFDLQDGQYCARPSLNPMISDMELSWFEALLGTNFDAMHTIKIGKKERQTLLQKIVLYFELHLHGFRKPRSLEVLNEVFN
ncbi:DNA repair protein RecO [Muriicola marianensis]|uniref:DNA repair protein RecO n=1 Tax=Muriicola marianensis TaxID=1324801 RepID=A0ABQ1R017_9FLAO|nr:DNA repair protein RecO [Muriicola marianensis]GGD51669.1 DNA repair protein RecO [Muriicola marianensis]